MKSYKLTFILSTLWVANTFAAQKSTPPCSAKTMVSEVRVFGDRKAEVYDEKLKKVVQTVPEFNSDMGDVVQETLTIKVKNSPAKNECGLSAKVKVTLKIMGEEVKMPATKGNPQKPLLEIANISREVGTLEELKELSFEKIPFEAVLKSLPEKVVFGKVKFQVYIQSKGDKKPILTSEKTLNSPIFDEGEE